MSDPAEAAPVPGRFRAWLADRHNRHYAAALVVALALRLAWVIWTTRSPVGLLTDPVQYRRIAEQLVDRHSPEVGGRPTAFWPPGWPVALAPLVWFTFKTGWLSLPFAASLLNVAASTVTVGLSGALAGRWSGGSARIPTTWWMALAAGPIYYTSSMLAETWFTMFVVLVAWLATVAAGSTRPTGTTLRWWSVIGAVVGYSILVRGVGLALVAVPFLVLRGRGLGWRAAVRPTAALLLGTIVVLAPWTIRNGVEVGVWTPTATNTATQLCVGNRPGGSGLYDDSIATGERCFRHSPYDDPALYVGDERYQDAPFAGPDEPRFYSEVTGRTLSWMVRHPQAQLHLVPRKLFETFRSGSGGLDAAEDFGAQPFVRGAPRDLLVTLENAWYYATVALAALALAAMPAARRAWPIWGLSAALAAVTLLGIGLDRYQHPLLPLLAVLAGMAVAAVGRAGGRPAETVEFVEAAPVSPPGTDAAD